MRLGSRFVALFALLTAAWVGFTSLANAAETVAAQQSRVPKPIIENGKGQRCVEDTDYMRKNHMNLLMHQRDETVHKGIRTVKHSLKNCIECHASQKTNTVAGSSDNFCQSCHTYAAVKIDCFECHATKPKATTALPVMPGGATTDPHGKNELAGRARAQARASLTSGRTGNVK